MELGLARATMELGHMIYTSMSVEAVMALAMVDLSDRPT